MYAARVQWWHPSPRETMLHQRQPSAHAEALWHQLADPLPLAHCLRIQLRALQLLKGIVGLISSGCQVTWSSAGCGGSGIKAHLLL